LISGFCHDVDEICPVLGYHAAWSGSTVLTFWDNLSVLSSRLKTSKKKKTSRPLKMGPISCPEMSVQNYYSMLHNIPDEHSIQVSTNL
jgi:hypothetical protein